MKKFVLLFLIAGVTLSGCSQPKDEYKDSYRSVEELRDAFVRAGAECPNWEQTNHVTLAAESGTCSDSNVLSIYPSTDMRDEVIRNFKSLGLGGSNILFGENWMINDPQVRDLDPAIGGTFLSTN